VELSIITITHQRAKMNMVGWKIKNLEEDSNFGGFFQITKLFLKMPPQLHKILAKKLSVG
jgi:hypothetical protein